MLGGEYRDWLACMHVQSSSNTDLVAHFFRRAFDLLRRDGTFGLIATNTISQGDTRSGGLRWICTNFGEIYQATTRTKWPGVAAVVVSVVHVVKGRFLGIKLLDDKPVEMISAFLLAAGGHDDPARLRANSDLSFVGSFLRGMGFTFDDKDPRDAATPLSDMRRLIRENGRNAQVIYPYIGGSEINTHPAHTHHRYVINFWNYPMRRADLGNGWHDAEEEERTKWLRDGIVPLDYPQPVAADWPELLSIVEQRVKPDRDRLGESPIDRSHKTRWWRFANERPALHSAIRGLDRVLATASSATKHHAFALLPARQVFSHKLIIFSLRTHAAFCALQSRPHEIWRRFFGSSMKDDLTYTPSAVFETFPFPSNWTADPTLEVAGHAYYGFRAKLMVECDEGLTKIYNRFHDPNDADPAIVRLRELHADMDRSVLNAYGWSDVPIQCEFLLDHESDEDETASRRRKPYRYRWPDVVRDDVLARLMDLNAARADKEKRST